jgi:hypothetical protein
MKHLQMAAKDKNRDTYKFLLFIDPTQGLALSNHDIKKSPL